MITELSDINIRKAKNGFIVTSFEENEKDAYGGKSVTFVFITFDEVLKWLKENNKENA